MTNEFNYGLDNKIIPTSDIAQMLNKYIIDENELESFFLVDINQIIIQNNKWKKYLPDVKPFYAVKSNNDKMLLETLNSLGVNFDCASISEIDQVLSMNVDPSRIIYAHACKPIHHIKHASNRGFNLITFDSESELIKLKEHHDNQN